MPAFSYIGGVRNLPDAACFVNKILLLHVLLNKF